LVRAREVAQIGSVIGRGFSYGLLREVDKAETLGEPPEDPLLLFSVLYSFWAANVAAFNGALIRELAWEIASLRRLLW
jgi:hypothetical protein